MGEDEAACRDGGIFCSLTHRGEQWREQCFSLPRTVLPELEFEGRCGDWCH